jgi:hypothetical protein
MFSWRFCPNCGYAANFGRRHRRLWMRLIPATKYFSCRLCGCKFLYIINRAIKI